MWVARRMFTCDRHVYPSNRIIQVFSSSPGYIDLNNMSEWVYFAAFAALPTIVKKLTAKKIKITYFPIEVLNWISCKIILP